MCKRFKFHHTNKCYMLNAAYVLENNTHKILREFNIQADHLISARRPDLIIINKIKRTCKSVDFAVPDDLKIKLKESEKNDKYLDLARELKKLWNMKVAIIIIVTGAFGTVTTGLLKKLEDLEIRGRGVTIQTTPFWDRSEYWEETWRLEENCCHSRKRPSANIDEKNSQGVNDKGTRKWRWYQL